MTRGFVVFDRRADLADGHTEPKGDASFIRALRTKTFYRERSPTGEQVARRFGKIARR
jgi:hypothetical protein